MRITPKRFWCDYCRKEIPFKRPATQIVQAQADHLWDEHGIDISDPRPRKLAADPLTEDDSNDRFVVTSLTGYPITPDMHTLDTDGRPTTEWYVIDTHFCCEVIARFQNTKGGSGEAKAKRKAEKLNIEQWRWEHEFA